MGADISESTFSNDSGFRQANFTGATLKELRAYDCDFEEAVFESAVMDKVIFKHCNMQKTNMRNASMYEASIHTSDLSHSDLSYADLRKSRFTVDYHAAFASLLNAKIHYAQMSSLNLYAVDFTGSDLSFASLAGSSLPVRASDVNFTGANLTKTNIANYTSGFNFSNTILYKATMNLENLAQLPCTGADLTGAIITNRSRKY